MAWLFTSLRQIYELNRLPEVAQFENLALILQHFEIYLKL